MKLFLPISIAVASLAGSVSGAHPGTLTAFTDSGIAMADTVEVEYDCVFTSLWSAEDHPFEYPVEAHWSFPVLVAHSDEYILWNPSDLVTPGVQLVAEMGPTSVLEVELEAAGDAIYDTQIGKVQWNTDVGNIPESHIIGLTQTIPGLKVSPSHPLVSSISMINPSPDWFSGISEFTPMTDSGNWYQTFSIDMAPWDAGTDSGTTYRSDNMPTDPMVPPFKLTAETQMDTGVLLDSTNTTVMPVASWMCTMVRSELVVMEDTTMDSEMADTSDMDVTSKMEDVSGAASVTFFAATASAVVAITVAFLF
jgi:hypothetical protein